MFPHFHQKVQTVPARQVEVQEDHVRARRVGERLSLQQETQRLVDVTDGMKVPCVRNLAQRFADEAYVARIVLDEEDLVRSGRDGIHHAAPDFGREKKKVAPAPGSDSTQIRPP